MPYVTQAALYAALYYGQNTEYSNRLRLVLKQMFNHSRNLGLYVLIYKLIANTLRNIGMQNGLDSIIAGLVGGYVAFGESKGVSGSVNT